VELIAVLEAGVDFAEDDVSVLPDAEILKRIAEVRAPLVKLAVPDAPSAVFSDARKVPPRTGNQDRTALPPRMTR